MNSYTAAGFKTVKARTMNDAAATFAKRAARREYGRTGSARKPRLDTVSRDGTHGRYEAFIGKGNTGRNIWLSVYKA